MVHLSNNDFSCLHHADGGTWEGAARILKMSSSIFHGLLLAFDWLRSTFIGRST